MSTTENALQINNIKEELANKVKFSEMSAVQKREVIDQLFPNGVAFYYTDPKVGVNDWVFGTGNPNINSGGFWFGKVVSIPILGDGNIDFEIQM